MRINFFLAGCENACSGHGQCTLEEGLYKCVCIDGWAGFDCSLALEAECQDDIDNDHGKILVSVSMLLFIINTPKGSWNLNHMPIINFSFGTDVKYNRAMT